MDLAELVRSRIFRVRALIVGQGGRRHPLHQKGPENYLAGIFELVRDQKREVLSTGMVKAGYGMLR